MKKIEVFVSPTGQPQHLAVRNEHGKGASAHRAVCGADTTGQTVHEIPPSDAKLACDDCTEQFKLWKEVHG